eukprot:scaffold17_cov354-Pavlova_lutheri.AAC.23
MAMEAIRTRVWMDGCARDGRDLAHMIKCSFEEWEARGGAVLDGRCGGRSEWKGKTGTRVGGGERAGMGSDWWRTRARASDDPEDPCL